MSRRRSRLAFTVGAFLVALAPWLAPAPRSAPVPGPSAITAAEADMLLAQLAGWANRAKRELRLAEGPSVHRTALAAMDGRSYEVGASFGAILSESANQARPAKVEVVVGSDDLDSSRFQRGTRPDPSDDVAWVGLQLVTDDLPLAISRELWGGTDRSYKSAVALLEAKAAARAVQRGDPPPPDWTAAPVVRSIVRATPADPDRQRLRSIAGEASARLQRFAELDTGVVWTSGVDTVYHLATSEGTLLLQRGGYAVVWANVSLLSDEGVRVQDELQWVARTAADLPPTEEIAGEVEALGRSALARRDAQAVEAYEGPVLFEGHAAAELFRYLLAPELLGTPLPPQADKTFAEIARSGPRIGRKVLPDGWGVVDDPASAKPGQAGGFTYDMEGVAAKAVTLVRDGRISDLVRSRIPHARGDVSNGHARGALQSTWEARLSLWSVTPPDDESEPAISERADALRRSARDDALLVVKRLGRGVAGTLPAPTEAAWRGADGHEVPALSVMFQNVDRRTLRDIVAAGGGTQDLPYLDASEPHELPSGTNGLPTLVRAPRLLLVQDMELVFPGAEQKPHALPPPGVAAGQRR